MRLHGGWSTAILAFLVFDLLFLNYLNIVPLYKAFPFLSFLPHQDRQQFLQPDSSSLPVWQNAETLIKEKKIPLPKKILEVNLHYDENASPNLNITSVTIKNGYSPKYLPQDKGYELQLIDKQNNVVSKLTFSIPNKIAGILPPPEGEQRNLNPDDLILKKVDFTLTIPFVESAKTLRILDPQAKVIVTQDLVNVPIIDNKPNFDSIPGANTPKKQGGLLDLFSPNALAQSSDGNDGKLDITFISNGYSDMNQFHNDVNRMKAYLLTFDPFKTRASQILFHMVDNTVDLECKHGIIRTILICNYSKVIGEVNTSGVPYDLVAVVVNDNVLGGSSVAPILYSYNGQDGPQVFVHELGHALGDLWDEYATGAEDGLITNKVSKNCYQGTPLADTEVWKGAPPSEYRKGCGTFQNWHRSSLSSIMKNHMLPFFNQVSIQILNEAIDSYTGPFQGVYLTPTPIATDPRRLDLLKKEEKKDCTVTVKLPTNLKNVGTNEFFLIEPLSSGTLPYKLGRVIMPITKTSYTYISVIKGTYTFRIKATKTSGYGEEELLIDNMVVDAICPALTLAPTLPPLGTPIIDIPYTPTPVPSLATIKGDVNRDGCLDIIDLNILMTAIQTETIKEGTYPNINSDGDIDIVDLNTLVNAMQEGKNLCLD